MKRLLVFSLLAMLFFSCNNSKNKTYSAFDEARESNNHQGKKLMENNCYACHSPSASEQNRIGPPMIAIKKRYINSETTKAEFTESMQAWVKNPNTEDAKMFGAVKRFGVMPKLSFSEETIAQITDYMYDFNIEQPDWFEAHFNELQGNKRPQGMRKRNAQGMEKQLQNTSTDTLTYAQRGLKYALATQAILGKNLMRTIQEKGTLEAVAFCNIKAYPLTDSMAVAQNATIKRVSDKPRNQNNQANKKELAYIKAFKNDIKNNIEPKPIVDLTDSKVQVYYPISTNTMCLQCHGKRNSDIQKPVLLKLNNLYPQDKAIGYQINEIRGVWNITFDK